MTTDLMPFVYEGQQIRTIVVDDEPWFVASDVARILGYRMASDMTRRIDDDDRGTQSVRTPSGYQDMTIISEPGLYAAILGSQVEGARAFKRWLTHEVIPTIRRTGSFAVERLTPLQLAERLVDAERRVEAQAARVAELEPKADLADAYLTADGGDRLIGQAAKLLRVKEKDLRRFLIEERLIFVRHSKCGAIQYEPYAEFSVHFAAHETVVNHTWGACAHFTLRIRPRGIDLIRRRMSRAGLVAIDGIAS